MADKLSDDLASLRIDRSEDPNRRSPVRYVVYAGVVAGLCAAVYFVGVPYAKNKMFKKKVTVTEVVMVSPAQASVKLTATGYVVPQIVSKVAAKVAGKVSKVHVRQGMTIKAGDVLFELDVSDQQAAIAAARSRVAAAYARMQTARATMTEAKVQADRAKLLSARGVSPESKAQDLVARVNSLQAQMRAAGAEAQAAQAEVKALQVSSKSYTVKAPISGKIINKPPELGEYVGPSNFGNGDTPGTIEIADFDSLLVEADVPETRLHMVVVKGGCEIMLDAFPGKRFRGITKEIVPKVNRAKATVTIKVAFADAVTNVFPEMSARVSFLSKPLDKQQIAQKPKKVVPAAAVVDRAGGKVVFAVNDGRVRMVNVTLGAKNGEGYELQGGPAAGTKVVKNPPHDLKDGQEVETKED